MQGIVRVGQGDYLVMQNRVVDMLLWIRYGISYIVVSVVCTILILIGNDLLAMSAWRGFLCDTVLELGYRQWLPVCAAILALSFIFYLIAFGLLLYRLPLSIVVLCCGLLSTGAALAMGIGRPFGYYGVKNLFAFFMAGLIFGIFSRQLRKPHAKA